MIYSLKHTDDMPKWKAGYSRAWFIRIRPAHKDDLGLLAHEKEHVRQWWITLGISSILYLFKRYRLGAEVKAYKEQMKYSTNLLEARICFAKRLVVYYNLGIDYDEAFRLLE